jgi:diacylglycerol kinase
VGGFLMGFVYAWRGIAAGARGRNFRVMLAVTAAVIIAGYFLKISSMEWCLVSLSIGLVLGLELFNTAGEKLVDILSPNHDPRYGMVKDLLAGAVLLAAVCAAVVGVLIFWPKLF